MSDPNNNRTTQNGHPKAYDNYAFYQNETSTVHLQKPTTEIAVQIENVVLKYGAHTVLDGINMNVPVKKIYALLGPSGCGE